MHSQSTAAKHHHKEEVASLLGIMLLVGSVTWTNSGTLSSSVQHWNTFAVVCCFLIFLLAPILTHGASSDQSKRVMHRVSDLLNDPLFWIVAAFLGFLLSQRVNSGRIKVFDPIDATWLYTPPPYPGLPWSIDPKDALDVLHWFFPAGILLITIRHGLKSRWSMHKLFILLVLHAGVLGVLGIFELASNPELTNLKAPPDSFAMFGYPNHAGAYFTLMFGLAVGLAFESGRDGQKGGPHIMGLMMGIGACLFATCAVLAVSRAAIIFVAILTLCALAYYVGMYLFRDLTRAKIVNMFLGAIGVAALCYFWIMGTNARWVTWEAEGLSADTVTSQLISPARTYPLRVAAEIFKDYPLYGAGGWGYQHLAMDYMTKEEKTLIIEGSANVHMDALQFLCEFGLVGFTLMLLIPAYLLPPFRKMNWKQPLPLFASLGLLLVVVASLIDLPFRNEAIICHWIAILALVSAILKKTATQHDVDAERF